VCKGFNQG